METSVEKSVLAFLALLAASCIPVAITMYADGKDLGAAIVFLTGMSAIGTMIVVALRRDGANKEYAAQCSTCGRVGDGRMWRPYARHTDALGSPALPMCPDCVSRAANKR